MPTPFDLTAVPNDATPATALDAQPRQGDAAWRVRPVVAYVLQVLLVMALLIHFVGRVTVVQGGSMEPGIVTGERIIIDLLTYHFEAPQRGDVIVFRNPRNAAKDYIKRVVALPGESIEIREGRTYVNGKRLEEPYVTMRDDSDLPPTRIGDDCVWVMGDNRANSEDSRRWGPLPLELVRGKARLVLWPPDRVAVYP